MTRKENVKRAIRFDNPEYIPLMYYGTARAHKNDALLLGVQEMFGGEDKDTAEWGFKWDTSDVNFRLGIVKTPAIAGWDELDSYRPLDPCRPGRFDETDKIMKQFPDRYYIAEFTLSGFTVASFIRGFEEFLTDLYLERENVEKLLDIVFDTEIKLMLECKKAGFDAINLADDCGTQNSLIISHDMIRELFMPRYKKQIEFAHSIGLDVILHSCGYVFDIIGDFIEAGLDGINLGQTNLNGIEKLGQAFRGKICFCPPIGYQTTAILGTTDDIDAEVKSYVDNFTVNKAGMLGFVASEGALQQLGASLENSVCVTTAFERYCGKRD